MSSRREKALRADPTVPEKRMWRLLHPFRTGGYHFRKQEQIGPFYVDFACHHARVVIEVDGDTHFTDAGLEDDALRDAFLAHEGYTVLRFTNDEVMQNEDGVYTIIAGVLEDRPKGRRAGRPLPGPPHKGEGEEARAEGERSARRHLPLHGGGWEGAVPVSSSSDEPATPSESVASTETRL